MNKQQIKNKMIKLGLKTNWQHFWTMVIMLSILVAFSVISWFLFIEALSAPNLPYNEQNIENGINEQVIDNKELIPVRITCYLWTGNKMANGEYPSIGQVAISDRSIPLNTKIMLDGVIYNIGDRTNKRFENFELTTIDIYWDGELKDCLEFGVKYGHIEILD